MSTEVLKQRAETLLGLHQPGNPVVLPTVWDAWSARVAVRRACMSGPRFSLTICASRQWVPSFCA